MTAKEPPANDNAAETKRCPICRQPSQLRYKPFCSKRCADVDLNRWLTGKYAIPVEEGRDRPEDDAEPG
jgi:uncharacterized protein